MHRVGRTARANASGVAITLINDRELKKFKRIEELIERKVIILPYPVKQKVASKHHGNAQGVQSKVEHL